MKVFFLCIFLFTASEIILLSQLDKFLNTKKEIILENRKQLVLNEYKVIVNILRDLSKNTFKGFINKPHILKTLEQRDRTLLYKILKKDYNYLSKLGFKQIHFHLPNNESFLRMHQPNKFGDNLTKDRYSVVYTNKYKKLIEGIEAGKVVPGYRFLYPLFLNNKYLGSVELSFSINKIVNEIEKVYKTHVHYLIKKDIYNEKVLDEFQKFYMPSIEHPDYVKLNRTYLNRIEPWYNNSKPQQEVKDGLQTKQIFNFELKYKNKENQDALKVVTFLPILNIENTDFSYFVFYCEAQKLKIITEEIFYVKIIASVVLFLFFIVIYFLYLYKEGIVKSRDNLKKFNKSLEKNVAEKTKKLSELNAHLENINQDLEDKIKCEVAKNREKDLQIFLQSKKASMGEMVGAIAHQWRQPLNELAIRIQKLQYDYHQGNIDEEFIDKFIKENKQTIGFMSKTIDGFRNFFRIDKETKAFSIKKAIKDVSLMLDGQFSNFNINVKTIGEDFIYNGYKTEFQQVVLNILNNAKDMFIQNSIENPTVTIIISKKHITIKDNGTGVPLNVEYKIFDPYFTTKEEGQGTGMGLYIAKAIIEDNLKGKLYLENSKEGASFHIKL